MNTQAAEIERLRLPAGKDGSSALTYSFAAADGSVCGFARLGVSLGDDGPQASALAVVFRDGAPEALVSEGAIPVADPAWEALAAAGLSTTTERPLERWTVAFGDALQLTFRADGPPAGALGDDPLVRRGGMESYEQPCSVEGRVGERRLSGGGQRTHAWGAPDWRKLAGVRTVSIHCGPELAVGFQAARPRKAKGHEDDGAWATVWQQGAPIPIDEPRLSTTYDPDGRQRRASLELWPEGDDAYPIRASGHVFCGSSLDLGELQLDCAFFRWSAEGRPGIGRYDLLRPAAG